VLVVGTVKRDDIPVSAVDYHVYYQLVPSLLMNDDIFAAATEAAEQPGSGCDDAEQAVKKVSDERCSQPSGCTACLRHRLE